MPEFVPDKSARLPDLDTFTRAYIECAEFTDCHGDNPELESAEAFSADFILSVIQDCADFQSANAALLQQAYESESVAYDESRAGHDFWLTRNGHGAGFWDRGLGQIGRALTDAAHAYGTVDLYAGDDNLIYDS